jgi:hypothetical protein
MAKRDTGGAVGGAKATRKGVPRGAGVGHAADRGPSKGGADARLTTPATELQPGQPTLADKPSLRMPGTGDR